MWLDRRFCCYLKEALKPPGPKRPGRTKGMDKVVMPCLLQRVGVASVTPPGSSQGFYREKMCAGLSTNTCE